jgi:hypothetical protein
VGVHLVREHAADLEPLDVVRDPLCLLLDVLERRFVALLAGEFVQLVGIAQRGLDPVERVDDGLERCALAP